ncbi:MULTISPECIES: CopD family protein [Psychroflexus]|jgi:putative membrane protein|uniref:Protoporphyrinogen IX oxidase n=1 Tax=Psychroflexus salarius TaxID=1155689 RepID=A0A1M4UYV1_9FLAO|nr:MULTISPECIES: CopD family protein [Psychroflexus]QSS98311.1 CopD family protein [Psychroflexus sp. ALD_RP9]SHE61931.1 putative membrane protein [Psychroflexus salarius]
MTYNYIKALHLIFVITWFAGLFYIPRLFIYQIEASLKPKPESKILSEQLKLMTKRLWNIITWPSAILATLFAVWLLIINPYWLQQGWMHVKLAFVILLFAYHLKNHFIYKQFQQDDIRWTSNQMRLWNEGATIILFAVVFLVILKSAINWIYGLVGLVGLAVLLMLGIRAYKNFRKAKGEDV